MTIHEKQVYPTITMRAVRFGRQVLEKEDLPSHTAGKTGLDGSLRRVFYLGRSVRTDGARLDRLP